MALHNVDCHYNFGMIKSQSSKTESQCSGRLVRGLGLIAAMTCATLLSGCGQKGDLYLPGASTRPPAAKKAPSNEGLTMTPAADDAKH